MDCVSKVQLHISCEGLKDKDVLSKSDPICAVYLWDESYKRWHEVSKITKICTIISCSQTGSCFAIKRSVMYLCK